MDSGWVKIHRKIKNWEWYSVPNMVHMYLHLILSANVQDKRWRGEIINRGQYVTSIRHLALETGLSVKSVRTCLEHLEESKDITTKPTHSYSIITVCKYEEYQITDTPNGTPNGTVEDTPNGTPNGTQKARQTATTKEDKNNIYIDLFPNVNKSAETPKPKTAKEPSLVTKGRELFTTYSMEKRKTSYLWSAKEATNMKQLFRKIEISREEHNLPTDDESLLQGFSNLIKAAEKMAWLSDSFDIPQLNSQYNKIVAESQKACKKYGRAESEPQEVTENKKYSSSW